MEKEITILRRIYQARLIAEDNEWVLKDVLIGDFQLAELYVPNENGNLPQKLEEFAQFLAGNWQLIFWKGKDAVDFLKKDWFQPENQPEFILEYIVWENLTSVGDFSLHFYDGDSDIYGDWVVKFYFKKLRGVHRNWI